jgi:hypothetical protein
MKNTFGGKAIEFYKNLIYPQNLHEDISIMNTYEDKKTQKSN